MELTYQSRNLENINKLADHTKAAALKWQQFLQDNDIDILIYETTRTEQQQVENVRNGKSQTMKSYHLVGQALDFVLIRNGKADWGAYNSPEVQKAVTEAKKLGFEWGGDWKNFVDQPHLQFNYNGYGTDSFGKGTESTTRTQPGKAEPGNTSHDIVPYPGHLIKKGSTGQDVKRIQNAVGAKPDGIFGPITERKVKEYQKRHGLAVDGIVGPKTWSMMF